MLFLLCVVVVQSDCRLCMMPPFFTYTWIELKRHGKASQQQGGSINHTELIREIQYSIFLMQLSMPVVIQMLCFEGPKHESAKLCQESCRVCFCFNAKIAKMTGYGFI
mmetsp:Transcript_24299/g.51549  ORF Transcript_24299/g.51549 Transcript_24299/m.51549 type:complete len:108 (-) Transcript_24299:1099-1422(-)